MAPFKNDPAEWERLDWMLFQNGPVSLYHRPELLDEDLQWLLSHGYSKDELDGPKWGSEDDFHQDIASCLSFPDYYGGNLNALNDCLRDLEVSESGGRVIVLRRFDSFVRLHKETAQAILDILAIHSWRALLTGRRFFILVQSDDPGIRFEPVGGHTPGWNGREWLNKNRGL